MVKKAKEKKNVEMYSLQNFKNPKHNFVTTIYKKIQEKFGQVENRFEGEAAF